MKITKIKNGKAIKISYEEGIDSKTLTSREKAAPEYYTAFSELALDIKTNFALMLGYQGKSGEEFIKRNRLGIEEKPTRIHTKYGETMKSVEPSGVLRFIFALILAANGARTSLP